MFSSREALDYVCQFPQNESIVFGASSRRNIAQTKQMIDRQTLPKELSINEPALLRQ